MQCNIDQRGRRVRLLAGSLASVAGIISILAGFVLVGVILLLAGGFMVFEGVKGWCALRALGFKTKL